jgi:hypothetical protein
VDVAERNTACGSQASVSNECRQHPCAGKSHQLWSLHSFNFQTSFSLVVLVKRERPWPVGLSKRLRAVDAHSDNANFDHGRSNYSSFPVHTLGSYSAVAEGGGTWQDGRWILDSKRLLSSRCQQRRCADKCGGGWFSKVSCFIGTFSTCGGPFETGGT